MQHSLQNYGVAASTGISGPSQQRSLPKHVQTDLEIQQLCDKYQTQLAELNACHSLLTVDQERLATMLAPYVNAKGVLVMESPDPDVMLFKQGLDLRLQQFEEDCKSIQVTERKLQQKIDEAASEYEQAVSGIVLNSDSRIFKRLREQQRQIELQQQEIDQTRFEKELLQEETRRLKAMTHRAALTQYSKRQQNMDVGVPSLHSLYDQRRAAPSLPGFSDPVLHTGRGGGVGIGVGGARG